MVQVPSIRSDEAYQLLYSHRYNEALSVCNELIRDGEATADVFNTRAYASLCSGLIERAMTDFALATELTATSAPREWAHGKNLIQIGVCHWLMGHHEVALFMFKAAVDGINDNSIMYADAAGGVEQGLFLWLSATELHDAKLVATALTYLKKRAKRPAIDYWPGSIAKFVLGDIDADQLVQTELQCDSIDEFMTKESLTLDERTTLCKMLFYIGISCRRHGETELAEKHLSACRKIENPITVLEWYIASQMLKAD